MRATALVQDITIHAQAVGVNETTAATAKLGKATDAALVSADKTEKRQLSLAGAYDRVQRSIDVNYRMQKQFDSGQKILTASLNGGRISTESYQRSIGLLEAKYGAGAQAASRLSASNDNLSRTSSSAATATTGLGSSLRSVGTLAVGIATALAAYAAALTAVGIAAAKVGMEMQALERGFTASAGSALQGGRELTFVRAEAERLGLAVNETAKQYMQMVAASRGSALEGQATRDIFVAVSQAMTALGKTSADTGGALNAIQQMMSKGNVQAEELRGQLGERLPGAFNLAAAAMGKTTKELNKMLDDGEVLASDLLPKLAVELNKAYGAAAAAASQDLGANLNRLKTAWTEYENAVAKGGLNDALNRAAQALTRFLQSSDGAALGQSLGSAIDWIVQALERVPRGFENLQIGAGMVRDLAKAFGEWAGSMLPAIQGISDGGVTIGDVYGMVGGIIQSAINGIIGASVAGYQMVAAAWQALPGVFAELAAAAGNALIAGIEAGVNLAIAALNKLVSAVNSVGSMLPDAVGFKQIAPIAEASFSRIEAASAGTAAKVKDDFGSIATAAMSRNYLGEAGKAVTDALDGQISKFRVLRADQDASNHLLREAGKIAGEGKVADAYNNAAKAGKAAKDAANDNAGAAKGAASAYDNLIQRTKDRIQELELEAQYASKTATEVIKLKLAHDLERAAKKDGLTVTAEMRKQWDEMGTTLAEATQNLERVRREQDNVKKSQEAMADSFTSFVEALISGTDGLDGALKSLGKTYVKNSLDALISGKGPMAQSLGLAPTEKGGVGGLLNLDWSKMTKAVEKGTSSGTFSGFANIFGFGDPQQGPTQSGATLDQANRGSALSGIAGIGGAALGAYGAGASGGALVGGLTGAISGAAAGAVFGPAGMAIGAILGAGAGILGASSAAKKAKEERQRQAQQAYEDAKPQFATFGSQLRGDPQNTLALQVEEARAATKKLTDIAFFASKLDEAHKLYADFVAYEARIKTDFARAYDGLATNLAEGVGPDSPFAQARDAVKSLGDALKGFIDDTKTVFGEGAPEIRRSTEAARAYAIAVLDGAKSMSTIQTRMQEIHGAAAGLQQVLVDLGVSARDAAEAVQIGTVAALARLKATFETDLTRKTNEATDKGYLNEAADLISELGSLRADAAALGTDQSLVSDYFRASAQSIVDGAELTGDAFADLIKRFPGLNGYVHEFAAAMDAASKAADIAARRLGYQDRLFAALNDTSTLEGQLAAFDRAARRDREAEVKAGGEAINDLEAALAAERLKIISDFSTSALREAQNFFDSFSRNLKQFVDGMRSGSESPLSPEARLAAAQSQYNAQIALAQGGDRDAINALTTYADALLQAGKDFYGSSSGFQTIFNAIEAQLTALPTQVSAEQFIVDAVNAGATSTAAAIEIMRTTLVSAVNTGSPNAIAGALAGYFAQIDTSVNNLIDFNEMVSALGSNFSTGTLRSIFTTLDADGDGQISRLELIRAATQGTQASSDAGNAQLVALNSLQSSANNLASTAVGLANTANSLGSSQVTLLDAIRGLQDSSVATLAALNAQFANNNTISINGNTLNNNMREALNKIVFNTAMLLAYDVTGAPWALAAGGHVTGPGTGTSDSINARLSNGEYVLRAAAVDRFGVGMLDQMNDNFRVPTLAMPMPIMTANSNGGGGADDNRMLREELRALRAELSEIKRAVVTGALHVREGVDQSTAAQRDAARETKFKKRSAA